jgi:hypothetical protein
MDKKDNVFHEEYATEPSTDVPSEPTEENKQIQTVTGETGYYDKDESKPYRVIIRAKEIEE